MKTLVPCVILLCLANIAIAEQVVEEWECAELLLPDWNKILVTAKVFEGRQSGNIDVANITHEAVYRVAGFERRWDFVLDDDMSYVYAFVIEPNGRASYYDFSNGPRASASMLMTCRQKK